MSFSEAGPGSLASGVLDPTGPVAASEHLILLNATVIMLAVILPVIVLTLVVGEVVAEENRTQACH